jgi:hypothetical protein
MVRLIRQALNVICLRWNKQVGLSTLQYWRIKRWHAGRERKICSAQYSEWESVLLPTSDPNFFFYFFIFFNPHTMHNTIYNIQCSWTEFSWRAGYLRVLNCSHLRLMILIIPHTLLRLYRTELCNHGLKKLRYTVWQLSSQTDDITEMLLTPSIGEQRGLVRENLYLYDV